LSAAALDVRSVSGLFVKQQFGRGDNDSHDRKGDAMSKLMGILTAATLAFAVGGFAYAADEPQQGQPRAEPQSNQPADSSKREQEYMAALKRCEPLYGADKQKCIEAAKKKYSEM
jgi:hypothetical protein